MGDKTGIEWTEATWNPTTGCDQVSPGCDNCYALGMAKRLKAMGSADYQTDGNPTTSGPGFGLAMHPHRLDQPLRWTKARRIFVNSMSDLFHKDVTDEFIASVFAVMHQTPRHTFQILTKRHARMRSLLSSDRFAALVADRVVGYGAEHAELRSWPMPNVWLGVSVENQTWADIRIPALLDTTAAVRFLSCEPLLGPVWTGLGAHNGTPPLIDWIIVGGESGHRARPMHPDWARSLRDQAVEHGTAFHFKQWGEWLPYTQQTPHDADAPVEVGKFRQHLFDGKAATRRVGKHAAGRLLDGREWNEAPA